jgi:tape measure domain-containing protein
VATASSTVELIVEAARAINPLRKVERQTKRLENQFEKARRSTKRVEAALVLMGRKGISSIRDLQANTARLGRTMGGLRGNVAKATLGFAAFKSVQEGIRRIDSERRLRLLTQRFGETAQAQEIANRAAEKFNLSQTEANTQLSRLIARLRPMGLSMKTIETAFAGFNTATILAGATASESAGAFLQLSQALGSGVLRGQELNSILEQAPLIAQAIATEMGSTVGALKKFGEEGKITSEIVIAALGRVERQGADQLAEALGGPSAKIKDFQNAVQDAQVAITESSIPAITDSIKDLGTVIRQLEPAIKFIGELLAGVAKTVGNVVENVASGGKTAQARLLATRAATLQTNEKFGKPGILGRSAEAQAFFDKTLERELSRRLAIARGAVPGQLPASAATSGTQDVPGSFKPTGVTEEETKRLKKIQEQGLAASERLRIATAELAILKESDAIEKIRLQFALEKANVQADYAAQIKDALTTEERQNLEAALRNDLDRLSLEQNIAITDEIEKRTNTFSDQLAHQDELNQLLQGQNDIFADIGQTIQDGLVRGIEDAITGAKSLREALSGVLKSIGGTLLRSAINSAVSGINFGGGGGGTPEVLTSGINFFKAEGGYASGATNAVVGEAGPEYIIPESKMRESMARYSRGVRGSAVIPENGEGGTNSMGGGTAVAAPIDVRYTVERINSVDYVTADQFQRGMQQAAADGAKQGEQRALTTLRQNTSQRRRIGL